MIRRLGRSGMLGLGTLVFFFASQALLAQAGQAEIRGRVLAPEGEPLPQALLLLVGQGEVAPREVSPDAQGFFRFVQLGAGVYRLEIRADGYLPQTREGLRLSAAGSLEVSVVMEAERVTLREVEERGARERNPNIFIRRLGLSTLRDPLRRRGIEPVLVQFEAVENHHGTDVGAPLREIAFVRAGAIERTFHGSLRGSHQNSALNARPFFNVGPLRPTKLNQFGFSLGGPVVGDRLSFDTSLDFVRESGFVNGNIRVPLPEERTPLTDDPQKAAFVATLLQAYPDEEPNLGGRRLNTNAVRRIRSLEWDLRMDYHPGEQDQLAFQYSLFDYNEDPFELVIGQNPRTENRPQTFAASHVHSWSPQTLLRSSFQFDRVHSLLVATDRFQQLLAPLGLEQDPTIDFGGGFADLTAIGPDRQFPRKRVQNRFSGDFDASFLRGNHHWRVGGRTTRVQVNDLQSNDLRGTFVFSPSGESNCIPDGDSVNQIGYDPECRSAVDNFRLGIPIQLKIAFGDLYRGFRNWEHALYLQDTIQLRPGFTLTLGLRYEAIMAAREVNNRVAASNFYPDDINNYGPQVGLAWTPAAGTTVRAGYGISWGHIFPGIIQRIRFNAPAVRVIPIETPDLLNPLQDLESIEAAPTEETRFAADLHSQYSHQYNLLIQQELPWDLLFRVGYVGNRTKGPFFPFVSNLPVPGPDCTPELIANGEFCANSRNIQARRPDPSLARILTITNAGTFYYDALTVGLTRSFAANLGFDFNYVFSKAMEDSTNFLSTFNREAGFNPSQSSPFDIFGDVRAPSDFDHRHIMRVSFTYDLPSPASGGTLSALLGGWSISAITNYNTGIWFSVDTSSDGRPFGNVDGFPSDRVNILNPSLLGKTFDDPDTSQSLLRPEDFSFIEAPGGRGNISRAAFRGDPISNTNLSLTKAFSLAGGEQSLRIRANFQNLFNHAHFSVPGDVLPSDLFGQIVDTENKGRVIQIGLSWNF